MSFIEAVLESDTYHDGIQFLEHLSYQPDEK
jgi:hypothetical protein